MHVVIAKSTFDHPLEDSMVSPGQPLILEDKVAATLVNRVLAEPPRPAIHYQLEEGPRTEGGSRTALYHKGGGSYLVLSEAGEVLNEDLIKGQEDAEAFARDYTRSE